MEDQQATVGIWDRIVLAKNTIRWIDEEGPDDELADAMTDLLADLIGQWRNIKAIIEYAEGTLDGNGKNN